MPHRRCPSITLCPGRVASTLPVRSDVNLGHRVAVAFVSPLQSPLPVSPLVIPDARTGNSAPSGGSGGAIKEFAVMFKPTIISDFLEGYFWGYANILLFLKVSPSNFIIHEWILPAAITTVIFPW